MTTATVARRSAPRVATSPSILLAGAVPGDAAGNAVSAETLLEALRPLGPVGFLSHEVSALPRATVNDSAPTQRIRLGTQPLLVHGEAALAARLARPALRRWSCAWAVNSRYAGALRTAGIPYAIWEPTTLRDELDATSGAAARRAGRGSGLGSALHRALLPLDERLEGRLYRGAVTLCVMAEYGRERISAIHGIAPDRIELLTHPPAPAFLRALAADERTLPAPPAREEAALRLLFVGRVDDPRKNFPLLLDVMRALPERRVAATLTVVGPHTEQWRRALDLRGIESRVHLAGRLPVEGLVRAYRTADVLVVPSRQEGFGIVVAEAMHAGLPVVSTRCGGPEGMIRDSGGGLLSAHDAASLADALVPLGRDAGRRETLARAARRYARTELSFERFAAHVAEINGRMAPLTDDRRG